MVTLTAKSKQVEAVMPEEEWLEAAFREHWSRIYQLIYRLVGDDEAEDLALETFWRLHRKPPIIDPEQGLGGWLYRVAMNLGFNALRARERRRMYEFEAGSASLQANPPADPAVEVEQEQERQRVRAVLARLKPRAAQALILRYSGATYAEIASSMGVKPGSVGTILARAEAEFERHYRRLEEGG